MTNMLLRRLRSQGIVLDGVVPFASNGLIVNILKRHPEHVVMEMPKGERPGPYWLVTEADAQRMEAAGHKRAPTPGEEGEGKSSGSYN